MPIRVLAIMSAEEGTLVSFAGLRTAQKSSTILRMKPFAFCSVVILHIPTTTKSSLKLKKANGIHAGSVKKDGACIWALVLKLKSNESELAKKYALF